MSTCCGLGAGNRFTGNDVYRNPGGIANASGLTVTGNLTADPHLADPACHDYRLTSSSPAALASWGLWNGGLSASTPPKPKLCVVHGHRVTCPAPTRRG